MSLEEDQSESEMWKQVSMVHRMLNKRSEKQLKVFICWWGWPTIVFFFCCCWVSLHVTWIFPEIFSLILIMWPCLILGFPGGSLPRWPTCQCRRRGLDLWNGKIPWRRKGQPTPAFLPREFHGQRNLAGYNPCGHKWVRHDLVTKQQQLHPFGLAY